MSQSLDDLKVSRASTKGSITRIKNLVETKTLSSTELECRLGILESYFKQGLAYQTAIESHAPADTTGRSELEELYVSAKTKILSLMGSERGNTTLDATMSIPQIVGSNLPKLKLPRFDGKYSEYKNFINSYEKLVDKDLSLSKIEKFNHLLNCLSGAALSTVKAFQITEENYSKALQSLKRRFDNNCLIFLENISLLFELPKVQKTSAAQLRNLVNDVSALLSSLKSLGTESEICEGIIIHLAMSKVDTETQSKWDEQLDYKTLPTWQNCSEVISKRCQYLEARESKMFRQETKQVRTEIKKSSFRHKNWAPDNFSQTALITMHRACCFCDESSHAIANCSSFLQLSSIDRFTNAKNLGICINCLTKGHNVTKCTSTVRCKTCKKKHHSLLHRLNTPITKEISHAGPSSAVTNSAMEKDSVISNTQVILATAIVLIQDVSGCFQLGRVLMDSGSQVNFIKEEFAHSLNLRRQKRNVDIIGIGTTETKTSSLTRTTIRSRYSAFELSLEFLVAPSITGYQPDMALDVTNWNLPRNLELADEQFNQPAPIDILLGAEAFFGLLLVGQIKLGTEMPILQNTHLGWIVSGRYKPLSAVHRNNYCFTVSEDNLEAYVERFWELESVSGEKSKWTEEQIECEEIFNKSIKELPNGRLMLELPFKKNPETLGESYGTAFRRFMSLERRLQKDSVLKAAYADFLREYQVLGHMSLVKNPVLTEPHYFLPHQCVLRPNSLTTKLRVVFDASCRTSTQVSLNSILMAGPTIQDDLFLILLRFRMHKYVLTADVVKMYRQILIHPSQRRYLYILWRESEGSPVETYELNTVTYGTTSAPFMAIRCLKYLGDKFESKYKLGAHVLRSHFYVDDMITGADDFDTLEQIQREVVAILASAGFELSKWHSNHPSIASPKETKDLRLSESNVTSTLGITWDVQKDNFCFSYSNKKSITSITKRKILSIASSLFDPLGLLCPIIVRAKTILQQLWIDKITWDAAIPQSIDTEWRQFMTDLNAIQNIQVPRYALPSTRKLIQIHGFCDASIKAYGCCLYVRTIDDYGFVTVKLLVGKSKVAPSKKKQIPRLELCAAHLLVKVWSKIRSVFKNSYSNVYFWTDSSVVLHWISTHSSKLSTFVGNRVAEIQENSKGVIWRHVPTEVNPADIVSRGSSVDELKNSIWFTGPSFLLKSSELWPTNLQILLSSDELELEKRKSEVCNQSSENKLITTINNGSSYIKIVNIIAYVLRYINQLKKLRKEETSPSIKKRTLADKLEKRKLERTLSITPLSNVELYNAFYQIVGLLQAQTFSEEIKQIRKGKVLKNSLKYLNPFLDESLGYSILKVGGRLTNAKIPEEEKHPILLTKDSNFSLCYARYLHLENYHAGPKSLVTLLRHKMWIINARELARKVVRSCIHCVRYKPKLLQQVMGNLPVERITSCRPFLRCGADFAGPIHTYHRIRGRVPYKSYITVFVCFVSKAVHLEPVSDLSSEAFIAALKRMISRRGLPSDIYCDNATNFVGADSKLSELRSMLFHKSSNDSIIKFCNKDHINFHFIPPRSPHFGGLWEAAVKVAKGHLYRSLQNSKLSFEELATALCEIEAVMNSRPITPLSSDPNDFEALTPGHLLIGSSLKAIPEPGDESENPDVLPYWRRINNVKTHFWRRWQKEYLQELQQRSKWFSHSPNLAIGSMVVVHEDNLPPLKWSVGRVQKTFSGTDGRIRVAEIRTPKGVFKRPIHKLALLPC